MFSSHYKFKIRFKQAPTYFTILALKPSNLFDGILKFVRRKFMLSENLSYLLSLTQNLYERLVVIFTLSSEDLICVGCTS